MNEIESRNTYIGSFLKREGKRLAAIQEDFDCIAEWNHYPNNYTNFFAEFEKRAPELTQEAINSMFQKVEALALNIRSLAEITELFGSKGEEIATRIIGETLTKKVGYTPEGWFVLAMPIELPKRNKNSEKAYIRDSIIKSLKLYFASHEHRELYHDYVFCVETTYGSDRPKHEPRDNDNHSVSTAINAFTKIVTGDDNPGEMDFFVCSDTGEETFTTFYIVPRADFGKWYAMKMSGELCDLQVT